MKSRIWLPKERTQGKYVRTLAKIQVTAIFFLWREFFTQIYRDLCGEAMLMPLWMGYNMVAANQQKHLSLRFVTKA